MRLTPAQIAIRLICGQVLPPSSSCGDTMWKRLKEGREHFIQITGEDFGYDLQAWHDHLKESRLGGYTYGRNIVLPKMMQAALESEEWQIAKKIAEDSQNY